jgi:hypothetical protein
MNKLEWRCRPERSLELCLPLSLKTIGTTSTHSVRLNIHVNVDGWIDIFISSSSLDPIESNLRKVQSNKDSVGETLVQVGIGRKDELSMSMETV